MRPGNHIPGRTSHKPLSSRLRITSGTSQPGSDIIVQ